MDVVKTTIVKATDLKRLSRSCLYYAVLLGKRVFRRAKKGALPNGRVCMSTWKHDGWIDRKISNKSIDHVIDKERNIVNNIQSYAHIYSIHAPKHWYI